MYEIIWTQRNPFHKIDIQRKFSLFVEVVESQLENYPENKHNILSIYSLSKEVGVTRNTISDWLKKYLQHKYGPIEGPKIYKAVWTYKQGRSRKLTYEVVKRFIEDRDGELLTQKEDFDSMPERPSKRILELRDKEGHTWSARVNDFYHKGRWCPVCHDYKTQEVLCKYMEKIFGVKFQPIRLSRAYGVSNNKGGLMIFDGYNAKVKVGGKWFSIAFEYDGEQHDVFPNAYHKTRSEFLAQQVRDLLKDKLADEHNTIIIRIKAVNGFNYRTNVLFQREIIKQFNSHKLTREAGVRLRPMPEFIYDLVSNSIKAKKGPIDSFLSNYLGGI